MTTATVLVSAVPRGVRSPRAAAEFPALTRLARVLIVTGALCLCTTAVLVRAAGDEPFNEPAALLTSVGVMVCGAGLAGLAVRWPPGRDGRRSVALLAAAVVAGLAGLAGLAAGLAQAGSGSAALFAIGFPAASGLLAGLLTAGLLRSLLWRSAAAQPQQRPALPRQAWRPCAGLGLGGVLLLTVVATVATPSAGPAVGFVVARAAEQTVEQLAHAFLLAALLAAVLLHWLHVMAPQVRPAAGMEGDDMGDGAGPRVWDAVAPRPQAMANLATRLIALGLGALALTGVLAAVLTIAGGDSRWLSGLFVVAVVAPVAGSAALTAGLVGLLLSRSLPLLIPAPPAPQVRPERVTAEADPPARPAEADPDARWRP